MSLKDTVERVRSGVLNIVFLNDANEVLSKGSGFMSAGFLVTNNHVFVGHHSCAKVWIRGADDSATNLSEGLLLDKDAFSCSLKMGSDESAHDYAVLDIPPLRNRGLHQFSLTDPTRLNIGEPVAFLGYPLDHPNLTCHSGIMSSAYSKNGVDVIQIDASVNPANSGGPLFRPDNGEVIGVVTRKATGLTPLFDQLRSVLVQNVGALQSAQSGGFVMTIAGINPLQAAEVSQVQVLQLLGEIERSANVGIGYAFSVRHMLEHGALS